MTDRPEGAGPGGPEGAGRARRWIVRGRVQGVGFRWFVLLTARNLGLGGWVLNRPDGSVEVVAWGGKEEMDALERRLASGPPAAGVRSVECEDAGPAGDTREFEIRTGSRRDG